MITWRKLRVMRGIALLTSTLLFASGLVCADTYQWVDKKGVIGFADSIEKVPPPYRDSAKKIKGTDSKAAGTTPPSRIAPPGSNTEAAPEVSPEDLAFEFQERHQRAQAELAQLKATRERTQKQYDTLRAEFYARSFADPEADAKLRAQLADLDDQIQKKQHEVSTRIPDEARRAGVPLSVLTQ
jgi:hypothetical protein